MNEHPCACGLSPAEACDRCNPPKISVATLERARRRSAGGPRPRKTQDDLLKASFDETSARATLELFSRAYHESRDMKGLGWLIGSFFRRWPDLKDDFPWFERYQD